MHFVPEVQAFLKERGLPQKAEFLLDNAPSHSRESVLTSDDDFIAVKLLSSHCHSYYTAHGPRSDCVHEMMLLG
jgi:hypothetical protein